jgi:DNA repair exonuclease SbcCD ATPase subunit
MELVDANEQIQSQLTHLKAQSDDQNRSEVEKGEEMEELRDKVKKLEEDLHEAEKKIQARGVVGEKALSAYKKKAQNSLAVANARAAAAMQAREEAELEARAARSTADVAVERAQKAEAKGNDALEEAKSYVKEMEQQKADVEAKANAAISSFSKLQAELEEAKSDAENARAAREKLAKDMTSLNHDHELEKSKAAELQGDLADVQQRSNDLYDEVETLREELRKSATAAFMAQTNDGSGMQTNGGMDGSTTRSGTHISASEKSESEATILILQRELQDSNQAIKELKESLRSTLENQSQNGKFANASRPVQSESNASSSKTNGNDSTPLFYAMEKQAELNQAREEINRLATLLGELQSEKMQAYDAVEGMKREKEDAESRLARYEKLGPSSGSSKRATSTRTQQATFTGYGANASSRRPDTDTLSIGSINSSDEIDGPRGTSGNSAQVNLEYLKNVMVSYLKAKTLNERKRLLPAVSAVLCLTPEEAAAAMKSVEESGSVESVGMSLFEGLKLM